MYILQVVLQARAIKERITVFCSSGATVYIDIGHVYIAVQSFTLQVTCSSDAP